MKKMMLFVCSLLLASTLHAEDGVVLLMRNGDTVRFAFGETPVLVTGESLTMKTASAAVDYDYAAVARAYFDEVEPSGIGQARESGKSDCLFRLTDAGVEVSGLAPGEGVAVYTVGGSLVTAARSREGQASLLLPAGSRQTYVVKTDKGVSFKFNRR